MIHSNVSATMDKIFIMLAALIIGIIGIIGFSFILKTREVHHWCIHDLVCAVPVNIYQYHSIVTNEEWEEFTKSNIEKAAKEINSARHLRAYTDIVIKQAIDALWDQYHAVNNAFKRRIAEIRDAKNKMEVQHSEIVRQSNEITRTVSGLEKSLAEKERFAALAHTRLGNRAQRPEMELCKDAVEIALVNEVADLRKNCAMMQHMLAEAHASLRYLLKIQIQLEEDMNVKTNSLKIDEVDCMTLRESMDYHAF